MSAIIINEFVDKFVALLGDGEHKEAMIVLATEFYNSTKKAVEKKAAAKKDGKEKKEKKEGGLKQPPNSYLIFSSAVRSLVKDANPEMKPTEVSKEIGKQWNEEKEANTETYQKYTKQAEQKKAEYKEAKEAVSESDVSSSSDAEEEKKEKKEKKRAPSAYNIFYSNKYAELASSGDKTVDHIRAEISATWKGLTPEEKDEYKGKALSPKSKGKKPVEKVSVPVPVKVNTVKTDKVAEKKVEKKEEKKEEKKAEKKEEKKEKKEKKKAEKVVVVNSEDDEVSLEDFDDDFGAIPPKKISK